MRIIILGSGVIGVTTAWYLTQAGHQVTVVDRQAAPALETSFANAGQISPGYSAPWAAPGVPKKAIKWLLQDLAPLIISPKLDWRLLRWLVQMLSNCNPHSYEVNKARMIRVAEYSRDCLQQLRSELGLSYDQRTRGTLQVFRTEKQRSEAAKDIKILQQCGVDHQLLDMDECIHYEPALAHVRQQLVGGLRLPGDETGDCFKFTQQLAQACIERGVEFKFNTHIKCLVTENNWISGVETDQGVLAADRYIVALGSYSPLLLKPLGLHLPIYPVKGYSLTMPLQDPEASPVSTVMDETYKVAVTRLGDRIRVGGTAELSGYDRSLAPRRRANAEYVVKSLFPHAADVEQAEFWCGLRPMTPDGTPIIGPTDLGNLYLNTGHGTLGWTMAAGSGRYLADLICGIQPKIDTEGLSLARYQRTRHSASLNPLNKTKVGL